MKKLLIGSAVIALMMLTPAHSAKGANNDNWFGSVLNNIISNSGLSVGIGNQNQNPANIRYRYQFHPASAYVKQCLNVPHRYVDRYGNYHDYSRTECRMILRGPYAGK